jgi:hypothetical protein
MSATQKAVLVLLLGSLSCAQAKDQQAEIIEFLKQLQVLPDSSPREVTENGLRTLLNSQKSVKASEVLNQQSQ